MSCGSCGQPVPEGARFCPSCGTPIAGDTLDRRLVTVLFGDLVGSTSLAERLDPEVLSEVVGAYHEAARAAIERNGGTVAAFQGDGAIGVFGLPTAHEDDAVRAARAGLELLAALSTLEAAAAHDVVLQGRVGLEAGEVLGDLGKVTSGTLSSDVFNTAARIQSAAATGTVVAGETAIRLLRDRAELRPLPPIRLKGKMAPVSSAQVVSAGSRERPRSASPFVGRERQLAWLDRALDEAVADGTPMLATVIGDPGIGKSRLLDSFALARDDVVMRAAVRAPGEGTTFEPIADLVHAAVGGDTVEDVASRLEPMLTGQPDAAALAASLRSVLGLGEQTTTDLTWTFRRLLETVAANHPAVIVFDDVHWGSPALLDLIEDAARWTRAPVLLVCGARPDLLDVRPTWGGGLSRALSLTLGPLDDAAARSLTGALLGAAPDRTDRVVTTAEGNPLFIEQLAAEALELGDRWDPTTEPTTIRALLEARVDRCPYVVARVLGVASVQGARFDVTLLASLLDEDVDVDAALHDAARARLAERLDADTGAFTHALVRETLYRRLPKAERADLHAAIAALLPDDADDEQAGAHLERAAALRTELGHPDAKLERHAGERLARTGARAFARLDLKTSSDQLGRAAALLPEGAATRLELLPDLAVAWMEVGRVHEAEALLADAVAEAERSASPRDAIRIRLQQLALSVFTEAAEREIHDQIAEGRTLVERLAALEDDVGLAQGWIVLDYLHWLVGEFALAHDAAGRSVSYAVRADRPRERVQASGDAAMSLVWGPATMDELRAKGASHRDDAEPLVAAGGVAALAVASGLDGDRAGFDARENEWRSLVETHGLEWAGAYHAAAGLAPALLEMGDPERAEAIAREGLDTFERLGDVWLLNSLGWFLPIALARQDRIDEAAGIADALDARYDRMEATGAVTRAIALSLARAGRGRHEAAISLAAEAAAIARRTDSNIARSLALEHLGRVQRPVDPEAAVAAMQEANQIQAGWGNVVGAARTRRTLEGWAAARGA